MLLVPHHLSSKRVSSLILLNFLSYSLFKTIPSYLCSHASLKQLIQLPWFLLNQWLESASCPHFSTSTALDLTILDIWICLCCNVFSIWNTSIFWSFPCFPVVYCLWGTYNDLTLSFSLYFLWMTSHKPCI